MKKGLGFGQSRIRGWWAGLTVSGLVFVDLSIL